jgi:hypothetical protein
MAAFISATKIPKTLVNEEGATSTEHQIKNIQFLS